MSLPIQNTTTTNTFDYWRLRTNEMAVAFTDCVVTTDANASSTTANGSAAITGNFTANSFYGNGTIKISNSMSNAIITTTSLYLGNSSVSINISSGSFNVSGQPLVVGNTTQNVSINSTSISISNSSSNIAIYSPNSEATSSGQHFLNANGEWSVIGAAGLIEKNLKAVTTTSQTVDNFQKADIRAAEYLISVIDNSANNRQTSKVMVTHDNTLAYVTEYAQHVSNTLLGNYTASIISNEVVLKLNLTGTASANVAYTRVIV